MSNIISFVSIKGGVGKTTIAIETAMSLVTHFNKKVLLIDSNFGAPNIGLHLDLKGPSFKEAWTDKTPLHNLIQEKNGLDIVISSLNDSNDPMDPHFLKKVLDKFKKRYDFIILDSSPNFEELKPVIFASDKIFIVTSPDEVTLTTSLKAANIAKENKTPIEGLIVNRIRSPKHEYSLKEIEEISKIPVMAKIRDDKTISHSIKSKIPMILLYPNSSISKEIKRFSSAICGEREKQGLLDRIFQINNLINRERINRELLREKFYRSN